MTTGTDEFSLYTRTDSYFSPSVKDGSIFTDPEKHKEFAFAKTYGSRLYELFNAEESAVTMFNHYGKAPIYTMKIAYGNNPKLVGEKRPLRPALSTAYGFLLLPASQQLRQQAIQQVLSTIPAR